MDLFTKAKELGIQIEFTDAQGRRRVTDEAALKTIIDALPPRGRHDFIDETVVVRSGRPGRTTRFHQTTAPVMNMIAGAIPTTAHIAFVLASQNPGPHQEFSRPPKRPKWR